MRFSRRQFLKGTSASLVAAAFPYTSARGYSIADGMPDMVLRAGDPALKELTARALEAARNAGAAYADVRFNLKQNEQWPFLRPYSNPNATYDAGIGVRALANGYWGYAALGGNVTLDDVSRLGREAAGQAMAGAQGKPRIVELAPTPVVANGTWSTPIEIDPFSVSWEEKFDTLYGTNSYFAQQPFGVSGSGSFNFEREEQTFASSEGSFYTQVLYRTRLFYGVDVTLDWLTERGGDRRASFVSVGAAGWEYVHDAPFEAHAQRMIRQAEDKRRPQSVDVGRYDIVFDGPALAWLANANLGSATELDRAMTYTANTVGTSYLNDPLAMLGNFKVGSPLLNVTANRSMPGGAATVKWDGEGVEPDDITLVKDGILTDFQTTRESASWLSPYYQKIGKPVRSHGGATCTRVTRPPDQGPHNLVIAPSSQNTSFEALCSGVKKGLAVMAGFSSADQQALNAESSPELAYEIVNGKLGRVVEGAVVLSRAPDFWKNLIALGGASTVQSSGMYRSRGGQWSPMHTISAPAALVKQVAVTTNMRRVV